MSICLNWIAKPSAALAMLLVLFGCGGGSSEPSGAVLAPVELTASPEGRSSKQAELQPAAAQIAVRARSVATPSVFRSASEDSRSEEAAVHLQLLSPDGVQASSLELPPVRGAGYATVKAKILSVRAGGETPVEDVRPYCPSSAQCEYRIVGRNRLDLVYVVKLPDDHVARLSAAGNEILITAKQTNMPVRTPVTITLEVGKHASTARVAYLGADATQEAAAQETPTTTAAPMPQAIKPAASRYPFSGAT
jgi:hypothetical protein